MEVDNLFAQEIQSMMHGCGDSPQPLLASARIVASTTRQQILTIIFRAESLMLQQGSRIVGPRDIVFLLRNKPHKLRRFLQYYAVKTFKTSMNTLASDVDGLSSRDLNQLGGAEKSGRTPFKDIIKLLDNTGELHELLLCSGLSMHNDSIRKERDQRADIMSQRLDQTRYILFNKARAMSFATNQQNAAKFLEWLQIGSGDTLLPKLTSQAVEILGYLAKETVAEIVDLALLVRKDSSSPVPGGPLRPLTLRTPTNTNSRTLDIWQALTPAEIREALRRFFSPNVGFHGGNIFGRNCSQPVNQQFLAL